MWLAFPPHDLAPLAWLALWPLLEALRGQRFLMRLGLGSTAGLIWSQGLVSPWLARAAGSHLSSDPTTAAALAAAAGFVYGGIYLAIFAAVHPLLPRPRWLMAPAAWVLLEIARGRVLGGAPWGLLGHSQHGQLALAQLAELGGVGALSFLCAMPAAALAERGRERRRGLAACAVLVLLATAFGRQRLGSAEASEAAPRWRVAALSGLADAADPVDAYARASAALPAADLTVWPESALPGYLQESPSAVWRVRRTARERGWLLLGARRYEGSGAARRYYNGALLVGPQGELARSYTKTRLVPFAERSPWPFPSLVERPFSAPPEDVRALHAGGLRVGVLICWESVFAAPAHAYARQGVDLLVNLTSDRDLGSGAAQHIAFTRFRAIETRRWLLRVSGTGATLAIDPLGRIHRDRDVLAFTSERLPHGLVVWSGWWLPATAFAILVLGLVLRRRRERDGANVTSHRATNRSS